MNRLKPAHAKIKKSLYYAALRLDKAGVNQNPDLKTKH